MRVSSHLLDWYEDRAKQVRFKLEEKIDGAAATAIDISASTAKVYLRCWKAPSGDQTASDLLFGSTALTKVTDGTGGNDAVVNGIRTINTATGNPGPLYFELVLVDETVSGKPTPSTYQERVLLDWGPDEGARLTRRVQP